MPAAVSPSRSVAPAARSARLGWAALVATALVQLALPLFDHRAGFTTAVVVGLAAATLCFTASAWGWRRAGAAAAAIGVLALAVEQLGVSTGWPFGRYEYTGRLRPEIGDVPVIVPLAWFAMGVPAFEVASRLASGTAGRVAVGAVALTAWDLFLDPQMVDEGFWRWTGDGGWRYRDIPLTNFAGWLAVSAVVMVVVALTARARRSRPLLAVYTWMAVVQTLGFLVPFGDPVVALVGGAVMLPLALAAWRRSA